MNYDLLAHLNGNVFEKKYMWNVKMGTEKILPTIYTLKFQD